MATRYSGELVIRCTYSDRTGEYHTTVSHGRKRLWSGNIRPPAAFNSSVDSPTSYDRNAKAAIAFADSDVPGLSELAAFGTNDYHVGRSKAKAWG